MVERVRFGSARPAVRRALVAELRSEAERLGRDPLVAHAADEIESLERKISRIGGVLVEVMGWAQAQDEDLVPDWVEKLSAAVKEEC